MTVNPQPKGLENVVAAESSLADVDGAGGTLRYRGYDIHDLVERTTFEEILALLWDGELPSTAALARLKTGLVQHRHPSPLALEILQHLPRATAPIDALRTVVSAIATEDETSERTDQVAARGIALRLTAQMPAIVAGWGRIRGAQRLVLPRPDLPYGANLLWMYHGREPAAEEVAALDAYLVLLAEHSLNASTFAARVVIGAGGDLYGAVTAAIGTLKGKLHGGANQKTYEMLEAIGSPAQVGPYLEESLKIKRLIMGIGHRIYKVEDPRARHLRAHSERLLRSGADPTIHRIAETLRELIAVHPYYQERKLAPNVEFFSAPLLGALGFPADTFPALFACSRIAGWSAHIFEQLRDNRLIRPKAAYIGEPPRPFAPLAEREPR